VNLGEVLVASTLGECIMDVREWKHFAFEDLVLAKMRNPADCAVHHSSFRKRTAQFELCSVKREII
jgi:hypothetical protein